MLDNSFRATIEQEIKSALCEVTTMDFDLLRNYLKEIQLKQLTRACPSEYSELMVRMRYSEATLKNYTSQFQQFINHFPEVSIDELAEEHIKQSMHFLITEKRFFLVAEYYD